MAIADPLNVDTASSCTPVDLEAPGGSMAGIPVGDQGKMGICYAYSETDLANAYLKSHNPGKAKNVTISPIFTAVEYETKKRKDDKTTSPETFLNTGGASGSILKYLKDNPACNASQMKSLSGDIREKLESVCKMKSSAPAQLKNEMATCVIKEEFAGSKLDLPLKKIEEALKCSSPDLCFEDAMQALDQACKASDRKPIPIPDPTVVHVSSDDSFSRSVNDAFDPKRKPIQPFTIGYAASLLKNGKNYVGLDRKAKDGSRAFKDNDGHESVVDGRRFNPKTGKCELRIKNSWGPSCNYDYSQDWECENGKIWVDQDTLAKNTDSVTYLKGDR